MKALAALLVLLFVNISWGANHYIRKGATGNGSGTDWDNALGQMPDQQVRGDVYYVADGEYPGVTLSGNHSGTVKIIMRKAIAADHGTDTGWKSEYGDGYAKFSGMTIEHGYIVVDGATGGRPGSWDTGHGFWVHGSGNPVIYIRERSFNYVQLYGIEIRHVKITCDANVMTIHGIRPNQTTVMGAKYEYLYFKDLWGNPFQAVGEEDIVIRYNFIDRMHKYGSQHLEAIRTFDTEKNYTVAYNIWKDCIGTAVLIMEGSDHKIYGNIFMWSEHLGTTINNGVITSQTVGGATNVQIYNNVFVDIPTGIYTTGSQSGHTAKNNIFVNCYRNSDPTTKRVTWGNAVDHSYNYYWQAGTHSEPNVEMGSGHPFVSYTQFGGMNNDLRLSKATAAGAVLAADYNTDILGLTRGADGNWDKGAYEYDPGQTNITSFQISNTKYQICPTFPIPINEGRFYNILGQPVQQLGKSGVYLKPVNSTIQPVTLIRY